MSTVPASIRAAAEPQVNLLPPEVEARRALGRRKGAIGLGFGAFVIVLGFAVYWAFSQDAAAKGELQQAVDEGARLQAEIDTYSFVLGIEAELKNARDARTYVGSTEVDFDRLLLGLADALPSGAVIESLAWSTTSVTDVVGIPVDGAGVPTMGSLTIRGQTETYVAASELEDRLNSVPGLTGARIVTQQMQGDENEGTFYTYDGTIGMNALALSGRFSAAWLQQDAVDRGREAVESRLAAATAELDAITAAETEGDALAAAQATLAHAQSDHDIVVGLVDLVNVVEEEILYLQQAVTYGGEGAAASLTLAETTLAPLVPILDSLSAAVNAWDVEATSLAITRARIAAAEDYVALYEERVVDAEISLAAGDEGAEDALATATLGLMRAEYGLLLEQSFLADAEALEVASRAALDGALVEVEVTLSNASEGEGA